MSGPAKVGAPMAIRALLFYECWYRALHHNPSSEAGRETIYNMITECRREIEMCRATGSAGNAAIDCYIKWIHSSLLMYDGFLSDAPYDGCCGTIVPTLF